jgi:hypothetical protein
MTRNGYRSALAAGLAATFVAGVSGLAVQSFAQDASPPPAQDRSANQPQPQPSVPPAGPPQNGVVKPPDVDPKMAKAAPDVDPKMAHLPNPTPKPPAKPGEEPPTEVQPR